MRQLIIIAALVLTACPCVRSVTMRDVFTQMPDTLFPYMTETNKLDMLDFLDSGMKAIVIDELGDSLRLDTVTDNYLRMTTSPASYVEMKLLPLYTDTAETPTMIVCMVKTYGQTVKESTIKCYTAEFAPLDIDTGDAAATELTVKPDTMDAETYAEACALLSPAMLWARLSPDDNSLTVSLYTFALTEEERRQVSAIVTARRLVWNGHTFATEQ